MADFLHIEERQHHQHVGTAGQQRRQFEEHGDAGGVVVGARGALDHVDVRGDHLWWTGGCAGQAGQQVLAV